MAKNSVNVLDIVVNPQTKEKIYNCVVFDRAKFEASINNASLDFKFDYQSIPETKFKELEKRGYKIENYAKGQVNFDSFTKQPVKPLVILLRITADKDRTIGYVVANWGKVGNISRVPDGKLRAYCDNIRQRNIQELREGNKKIQAIQNAVYVSDGDKLNTIRGKIEIPCVQLIRNKVTRKPIKPEVKEESRKKDVKEIFTDAQLKVLNKAKADGVDLKQIANPKLSPEQMEALVDARKSGVDISPFAKSCYPAKNMSLIAFQSYAGYSGIDAFLNPEFSVTRLVMLAEADILGLDLTKLISTKMSDDEAEQIKTRMACNLWSDYSGSDAYKSWY